MAENLMDGRLDRGLLLAIAVGIAAGTAATITSIGFPYAFGAFYTALQVRRKKEQREQRHRLKSEKMKKTPHKPKECQIYREILQRALTKWKDIDVSFDSFPIFYRMIQRLHYWMPYILLEARELQLSNLQKVDHYTNVLV